MTKESWNSDLLVLEDIQMKDKVRRRRGDIIWVELGEHPGRHIQSGRRPCLIVNTDKSKSNVYTVMPGTCKQLKKDFPVHVCITPAEVTGVLNQVTIFMAEQLVTVDEQQVILKVGHVDARSDTMKKINEVLIRQMELD